MRVFGFSIVVIVEYLEPVSVRVPFIPCYYCFKFLEILFRDYAWNDKRLLAVERVGVPEIDTKDSKDGTSDVPRGLTVPPMSDFDYDA